MINTKQNEETISTPPEPTPIPFHDNYTLLLFPGLKTTTYIFRNPDKQDVHTIQHNHPLTITETDKIGREIKKHLDPDNELNKDGLSKRFEKIKILMNEVWQLHKITLETHNQKQEEDTQRQLDLNIEDAYNVLKLKDQPLIYIGSLVSWLTAGERNNIMLTFLAYASQVVLRNPISVIGLGEGGSGKTHIQDVAMNLLPSEFIVHEKSITDSAMFRRAEIDPYFYDGKIVNYGDLGGRNSQDFVMEAKNLLKEMQSDGFINKPLLVPSDEGWEIRDLTLQGYPALTYTTVPGFQFDDQEMSRSIFITPRMDNKRVFNSMKTVMELKYGTTYKLFKHYQNEASKVKYMIYLLRDKLEKLTIINPYTESIINFLSESEYFKRDFDKYNGILKTITAFNGFNRETYELHDETILFTNLRDIQIFISILAKYHESINVNISPKSAEILDDIRANIDDWMLREESFENGFTIKEYMEKTGFKLDLRSFQTYFKELNNSGFIKVVDNKGRANVYELTGKVTSDKLNELLSLSDRQKNLIRSEMGTSVLEYVLEDSMMEGLSIKLNDPEVDVPNWDDWDV
jgi:predicted transcriptional regulator